MATAQTSSLTPSPVALSYAMSDVRGVVVRTRHRGRAPLGGIIFGQCQAAAAAVAAVRPDLSPREAFGTLSPGCSTADRHS